MHRKVAAALLAALALGVASCGGSEAQLTRAQLLRRIDVACRHGQATSQKEMRGGRGAKDFVSAIVAGQHTVMDELGDLNPPDAAKGTFDAFKQSLQDRLDLFERFDSMSEAALERLQREGNRSKLAAPVEAVTRRMSAASAKLGVRGCI
jgi:hypothetical protein